uniref:C-type lectin domain-containing protein n=1 Tax=Cyprinus carpio TaxID=7962 RepID=A0A8C1IJR8_CYPCA
APVLLALSVKVCCDWSHHHTHLSLAVCNASGQTSDAWVGLHKKPDTGVWKWEESGGIDAKQISWDTALKQPNNLANENCGFLYKANDKLHDENCFFTKPFYCMTNFVLVRQKETWDGALEYCRTHYNNLASLSTMNRTNSALLEITQAETEYVWTGLRFLAGDWLWVTGDDFNYTAWYQNEQPQCPARHLQCGHSVIITISCSALTGKNPRPGFTA